MAMFKITFLKSKEDMRKSTREDKRNRVIAHGHSIDQMLESFRLKMSRPGSDAFTFFVEGEREDVEAFYDFNSEVLEPFQEITAETVDQLAWTLDMKRTAQHDHTVRG